MRLNYCFFAPLFARRKGKRAEKTENCFNLNVSLLIWKSKNPKRFKI
jgi:hypothetical protein